MKLSERVANVVLAASVFSWAVLGLIYAEEPDRFSLVRLTLSCIHVCVAFLLIRREPLLRDCSWRSILVCLPVFLVGGGAFKMSAPLGAWPISAEAVWLLGTVLVVFSLLSLGKSFAVFPAIRGIRDRGPYRYLRHPAYLGELIMLAACCRARPTMATMAAVATAVPLLALRIIAEEKLLMSHPAYECYARRVRWRLVPGVW